GPDTFRVTADAFGFRRPAPDLVLCSGARVQHRAARLGGRSGGAEVLVPIADFADGIHVTQIAPMSAVIAYHIALDDHAVLDVNGLAVESLHPGIDGPEGLTGEMLRLYLSLFPYLQDLRDFGPLALPRTGLNPPDAQSALA